MSSGRREKYCYLKSASYTAYTCYVWCMKRRVITFRRDLRRGNNDLPAICLIHGCTGGAMKIKKRSIVVNALTISILVTAVPALAEWSSWGRVTSFHVTDDYPDIVRVFLDVTTTQPNPAACPEGGTVDIWIDIELNDEDRSDFEMQQMVNAIYMSMATYRNARFNIDPEKCSPDGMRLANGVGLQNP